MRLRQAYSYRWVWRSKTDSEYIVFLYHIPLCITDYSTCCRRGLALRAAEKLTVSESAGLQEKRNKLAHRIELWRKTQEVYLPMATSLWSPSASQTDTSNTNEDEQARPSSTKAEDIKLWLPSQLPAIHRTSDSVKAIAARESQLRRAQAFDALANIRRIRRIITGISLFRKLNLVGEGQRTATRLRSYYDKFRGKIIHSVACYRGARDALLVLDPDGDWKSQLLELKMEDVRGPGKDEDEEKDVGEGRREISWIWLVQPGIRGAEGVAEDFIEGMCVEWAKSKARAERWREEKELLQEEMRRVLADLTWQAAWWRSHVGRHTDISQELGKGLAAYAEKQAVLREALARKFAKRWLRILEVQKITPKWKSQYVPSSVSSDDSTVPAVASGTTTSASSTTAPSDEPVTAPVGCRRRVTGRRVIDISDDEDDSDRDGSDYEDDEDYDMDED